MLESTLCSSFMMSQSFMPMKASQSCGLRRKWFKFDQRTGPRKRVSDFVNEFDGSLWKSTEQQYSPTHPSECILKK